MIEIAASNNRAILVPRVAGNMLTVATWAALDSAIVDFRGMNLGSFQVWWANTNSIDSTFELYVSNYPDRISFGKYPKSLTPMDADCNAILWNVGVLGFRYGFVRYVRGATLTTGDMEIMALGKR
jgi:hypothetical protein